MADSQMESINPAEGNAQENPETNESNETEQEHISNDIQNPPNTSETLPPTNLNETVTPPERNLFPDVAPPRVEFSNPKDGPGTSESYSKTGKFMLLSLN